MNSTRKLTPALGQTESEHALFSSPWVSFRVALGLEENVSVSLVKGRGTGSQFAPERMWSLCVNKQGEGTRVHGQERTTVQPSLREVGGFALGHSKDRAQGPPLQHLSTGWTEPYARAHDQARGVPPRSVPASPLHWAFAAHILHYLHGGPRGNM